VYKQFKSNVRACIPLSTQAARSVKQVRLSGEVEAERFGTKEV